MPGISVDTVQELKGSQCCDTIWEVQIATEQKNHWMMNKWSYCLLDLIITKGTEYCMINWMLSLPKSHKNDFLKKYRQNDEGWIPDLWCCQELRLLVAFECYYMYVLSRSKSILHYNKTSYNKCMMNPLDT